MEPKSPILQCWPVCKRALQRAKESSSPSTHVQAEPGRSPDARVAEAQARVSRLQAALDLFGADNPDAELLKASLETAKRQWWRAARGRTSGFLFEVRGARPRTHRATEENCRGSSAALGQVRISVGRRVARFGTITSRSPCMSGTSSVSHTEPSIETTELRDLRREVEQLRRERNEWLAKPNSQFMDDVGDSRSSRMASLIDAADAKRRCLEPVP